MPHAGQLASGICMTHDYDTKSIARKSTRKLLSTHGLGFARDVWIVLNKMRRVDYITGQL